MVIEYDNLIHFENKHAIFDFLTSLTRGQLFHAMHNALLSPFFLVRISGPLEKDQIVELEHPKQKCSLSSRKTLFLG